MAKMIRHARGTRSVRFCLAGSSPVRTRVLLMAPQSDSYPMCPQPVNATLPDWRTLSSSIRRCGNGTVLSRRRERRSGTCGRRACPSSASPSIWAGRTRPFGCSSPTTVGPGQRRGSAPNSVSLEEREEISRGLTAGLSIRAIAADLERSPSTVCASQRQRWPRKYRAMPADRGAQKRALRPRRAKLTQCRRLRRGWSASSRRCGRLNRSRRGWLRPTRRAGDAGDPRDDLPVALRPGPRCPAKRAAHVPAERPGHATGQGLHKRRHRRRANSPTW